MNKRHFLSAFVSLASLSFLFKFFNFKSEEKVILSKFELDFQWPTFEPFLFCVHHYDLYPRGNGKFGPEAEYLKGRPLGEDFVARDGFRMYHGEDVPGFPVHPHRGFETVTIVRKGYVDHADSLGAAGRYGQGDVQWMTAGHGVQHSEMFPLLKTEDPNTVELFQIWLNLPKIHKMVPPHFTMLWHEKIPVYKNDGVEVTVIAGDYNNLTPPKPPPHSWASDSKSEVKILLVKLEPNKEFKLMRSDTKTNRAVYFFEGKQAAINLEKINSKTGALIDSQKDLLIQSGPTVCEILILQAAPIGEPVVQHGPFVMNSKEEIYQTIQDYQRTQFGGWSWPSQDMVHGPKIERFAKFPDGRTEKPS